MKNHKTILICSNCAWNIYNFRLPLISFLKKNGYKIYVIAQFDSYENKFMDEVDGIHNLYISRKGINPLIDFFTFLHLLKLIRQIKPDICLNYTIKPVIYGSLACDLLKIPSIATITGLGTAFLSSIVLQKIVEFLYKTSLGRCSTVFFQNEDDLKLFTNNNLINSASAKLIPGSGINLEKYKTSSFSLSSVFTFSLIARMIEDKGIIEFVEAAKSIKKIYPDITFNLLGPLGVENRSAIKPQIIQSWVEQGIINYLGEVDDIRPFIKNSDCIVLPSYREGASRVLLEAAAMGRPLIASNVPGCKEIIEDGVNGYLCAPKNSNDLKLQMLKMLKLEERQRYIMGREGRAKVEKVYDQNLVFEKYQCEIKDCLK